MTTEIPVYVCSHIFENTRPILLVSKAGGEWQCLCGGEHEAGEIPKVVGLNHLLERDPRLIELQDLPDEWEAERTSVSALGSEKNRARALPKNIEKCCQGVEFKQRKHAHGPGSGHDGMDAWAVTSKLEVRS